jgi:hypothetical protein
MFDVNYTMILVAMNNSNIIMVSTKTLDDGGFESKNGDRVKLFFPITRSPRLCCHVHL